MISFKSFYTEAKQVGILYHFTKISQLPMILATNTIGRNTNGRVSFTRDKHFMKHYRIGIGNKDAYIIIDGDKLSHRYKLEPYDYFGGNEPGHDEVDPSLPTTHKGTHDEQEERTQIPINDIKKYIIKIILSKQSLEAYETNKGAFTFYLSNKMDTRKTFHTAAEYIMFIEQFCPVEVVENI